MPVQSKIRAILKAKCPKCWEGDMFEFPLTHYRKFSRMNTFCPHCNLRFEVEPGFFIGAMYISYVMSLVIMFLASVIIYLLLSNPEFYYYIIGIPLAVLTLVPVIFRYSRVLFLHCFGGIKYDDLQDRTII